MPGFCANICICICVSVPRLLITSGAIWTQYDWLHKSYSFYVAVLVSIITKHGLSIDAHRQNQPSKHKLSLYKPSIQFNSILKWLYISSKMEYFNYEGGCSVMCINTFKEELALTTYK